MTTLNDFVGPIATFNHSSNADKLRLFAWFLHARENRAIVSSGQLAACFDELHISKPANLHRALQALCEQGDMLKSQGGYKLARGVREDLDTRHAARAETVIVDRLLAELPARLSDRAQIEYLHEALTCFRHQAYRSAILMTWNLAYDHLVTVIAAGHLTAFNAGAVAIVGPKAKAVSCRDDFQRWKESDVVRIANATTIISKEVAKVLAEPACHAHRRAGTTTSLLSKTARFDYPIWPDYCRIRKVSGPTPRA